MLLWKKTLLFLPVMLVLCVTLGFADTALGQPHGHRHRAYDQGQPLTQEQQGAVDRIMDEYRPRIQALHQQLHDKMMELKGFSYAKDTDPEVLPRLGRELQELREALREELRTMDSRLAQEAGVTLRPRSGRGCSGLGPHSLLH